MSRRRRLLATLPVVVAIAVPGAVARAEGWHSAQPPPPTSAEGQSKVEVPAPLGHIGQISFWAPNRGLLITAGTTVVPAGLYYYNGVTWRELSTVCGGADGRIAWAGENDFWTISNQQAGQNLGGGEAGGLATQNISLCHFAPGPSGGLEVVASYAEPIGVPSSYLRMDAAACSGPDDCWFGGERLPATGTNAGAFHLHWDGRTVTPLPSLETPEPQLEDPAQAVRGLAVYKGNFYESAQPGEGPPYLVHEIAEGSNQPFVPMLVEGPPGEAFSYSGGSSALQLSGDSSELWGAAGSTVLLLNAAGQFQQIKLNDPTGVLAGGGQIVGIAAEPGTEDAWVSIETHEREATTRVVRIGYDSTDGEGTVAPEQQLPEAGEPLAHKGSAGAIACPALGDCWVASSQGWLFHLGGDHLEDADPYFQGLITYRPPDASIPFQAPESYPEDDSGANPSPIAAITPPPPAQEKEPMVRAPLFSHVQERLVGSTTLALSFTLTTKSRVRLVARRKRQTVAHTASRVLGRGRHTLKLRLNRRAWPTKLDLQVHALGPLPLIPVRSGGHEAIGGPTAVETSYRRPSAGAR